MNPPNQKSPRTHINLAIETKSKGIKLAEQRWGKSGNLSLLISELIKEAYAKEFDTAKPKKTSK